MISTYSCGSYPGGISENSPAFQRRDSNGRLSSPEGTAELELVAKVTCRQNPNAEFRISRRSDFSNRLELVTLSRPLRDLFLLNFKPGVETPGYYRLSLRDRKRVADLGIEIASLSSRQKGPHLSQVAFVISKGKPP